jgi:Protein of unknown function (DUF1572)
MTAEFLEDVLLQFRKYKSLADGAIEQIDNTQLFRPPDAESNSVALIMKHMAGNMRSRWTRFLTSDGEKPDRNRDSEFEREPSDSSANIRERWDSGWAALFAAIEPLRPDDLGRTVTIRGEPHTVLQAIDRQLTHCAYHVGQIVFLARHLAGPNWKSLSIPKGKSKDFEVARNGSAYRPGGFGRRGRSGS